jgi:predicted dehydrogenase
LPAYAIAGYKVQGIYDIDIKKAEATAAKFRISHVFTSVESMITHAPVNIDAASKAGGGTVYFPAG